MFGVCARNDHSYTHLILALGIVREPTVWGFITSHYSCTHWPWRLCIGICIGRTYRSRGTCSRMYCVPNMFHPSRDHITGGAILPTPVVPASSRISARLKSVLGHVPPVSMQQQRHRLIHANLSPATRNWPFSALDFLDKNTGICAGAMPY